ncbi:hypothetical protein [Hyphomicrobium sp. D-2]|uniref:hypothetical protein n=1 Tax=Hyphomicrobium sp. D-2 TaxID=3041621 RepID=UPI0024558C69|nr:hypothetical protein [Hyphomicrobium sp. D-2]MDH4982168.1 hypothetical protein [Hyphomicrobium sp. D-2]
MDEGAILAWLTKQKELGRLRVPAPPHGETEATQLGDIAHAFFDISHGNPLHLIYSFEMLVLTGDEIRAEDVELLPQCPDGDIREYYRTLWAKLSPGAKEVLHLIAGCEFHWPAEGLRSCAGPTDEVEHMLEHHRSGVMPFHGSILAYARERSDHGNTVRALLPRVEKWLSEEAPPLPRWGWLWLTQSRGGDSENLVSQPTRRWAIESIIAGWPIDQMVTVLSEAEIVAFDRMDLARASELRHLKTRLLNGPTFQMGKFMELETATLIDARNRDRLHLMIYGLASLPEQDIVALARAASRIAPELVAECAEELRNRLNLWIGLRHRPRKDFETLTRYFIEVQAIGGPVDIDTLIRFIRQFEEREELFDWLIESLSRERRYESLVSGERVLRGPEDTEWRQRVLDAIIRCAWSEQADAGSINRAADCETSAFAACWLRYHKLSPVPPVPSFIFPPGIVKEYYEYGTNHQLVSLFRALFFNALERKLDGSSLDISDWLNSNAAAAPWLCNAFEMLKSGAETVASGAMELSFPAVYRIAESVPQVETGRPTEAVAVQQIAFRRALLDIAIDIHFLKSPVGRQPLLIDQVLEEVRRSRHWVEEFWLATQIEHQYVLTSADTAAASLQREKDQLAGEVTEFYPRADKWVELAQFAQLYNLPATEILRRAADCLLGHGWRKDLWLSDVLEALAEAHREGAIDSVPALRRLTPIIEQITTFTDGDETDHVRSELIDAVKAVKPDWLPSFNAHYAETEQYRYADEALEAHLEVCRLDEEAAAALAGTLLEARNLTSLTRPTESGDNRAAQAVLDRQLRFLGGKPSPVHRERGSTDTPEVVIANTVDVTSFGPAEFAKLHRAIQVHPQGYAMRYLAKEWLAHWKNEGEGIEALGSLQTFLEQEENPYYAEDALDYAFQASLELQGKTAAYYWLVQAHIHRHGWINWASKKEAYARLDLALKHYPHKCVDFIRDTSRPSRNWQKRKHSFTLGQERLIHFLLQCGQLQLAASILRSYVELAVEELSDQPIPDCPWLT